MCVKKACVILAYSKTCYKFAFVRLSFLNIC